MLQSRRFRLLIAGIVLALLFPQGRGIVVAVIFIGALAYSRLSRRATFIACAVAAVLAGLVMGYAKWNMRMAMTAIITQSPDGRYQGESRGKHGPIGVALTVKSGRVEDLLVTRHEENDKLKPVAAALRQVPERICRANSLSVDAVTGATETSDGIRGAAYRALARAMANPPRVTWLSRAALWVGQAQWERETLFELAIIFTVILFADFVFQGAIVPNTGQALNCMNCQACVGVCPVRRVEDGVPLPMHLVTQTRIGNYARVEELAQYCVGCGKCAAKCLNGISPLNIAGSAVAAKRRRASALAGRSPASRSEPVALQRRA